MAEGGCGLFEGPVLQEPGEEQVSGLEEFEVGFLFVLIVGQAMGIPVFLHFRRGLGLLVWTVAILAIGALGLLVSSFGPIRDLAAGTTTGGGLLLALGAGVLIGLWVLSHRLYLKQDQ